MTLDLGKLPDDLSPEVEQGIYRVAQEALENARRHAQASRVELALRVQGQTVVLMVSDNGDGFDFRHHDFNSRLGVQGMRERADLIGASLSIESHPGQGTQVVLCWDGGG